MLLTGTVVRDAESVVENGTTCCLDHLTVNHAERAFEAAGDVGVRGALGKILMDRESPEGLLEETEEGLAESRRLLEQYHRSFDDRIRYAVTLRFTPTCTEECLRGSRDLANREEKVLVRTHASEAGSVVERVTDDRGMRNIHWLDEVGLTGEDVVLAHVILTDDAEREVLAETGTHVTYCPSSNMKTGAGVAPVPDYLSRGINVALGNDGAPVNNTLDPVTETRQATLLQKVEHEDPRVLPAETVFEMATVNGRSRCTTSTRTSSTRPGATTSSSPWSTARSSSRTALSSRSTGTPSTSRHGNYCPIWRTGHTGNTREPATGGSASQ